MHHRDRDYRAPSVPIRRRYMGQPPEVRPVIRGIGSVRFIRGSSLAAAGLLFWLGLASGQSPSLTRTARIVETKPDLPTTLVFPTFLGRWGLQRARQVHARYFLGGLSRFDDPQDIAVTVLDARDDPADERDDDEITVYGVNSGRSEIIYNPTMSSLATYGGAGSGIGEFRHPNGIDADPAGTVVVADTGNNRVAVLFNDGHLISHRRFLDEAAPGDSLAAPYDVALTPDDGVWVSDSGNGRLVLFNLNGTVRQVVDLQGVMDQPGALAVTHPRQRWSYFREHALFVAERNGRSLVKLDVDDNERLRVAATSAEAGERSSLQIRYLTTDFFANLWATDGAGHQIHKFDRNLNFLDSFGARGRRSMQFRSPTGIGMWRRFGQVIIAEAEGAQYYWVGADARDLSAAQLGDQLEVSYHLTGYSYVTIRIQPVGGEPVEIVRRRFRRIGLRKEVLQLDDDRPLNWLEVVVEPSYSSSTYREKVFRMSFQRGTPY
ncbi:NHL repeat-containing protein [Gemmatimonadota bacterium]